jgi:hypothetical protein
MKSRFVCIRSIRGIRGQGVLPLERVLAEKPVETRIRRMRQVPRMAFALLGFASQLAAQGPVSVSGVVANEAARPIQHVLVTLDPTGTSRQVRTDRDGRFSFLGVPAGEHVLRVTWVGFAPDEQRITVGSNNVSVEVTLRRLTNLDTTLITARRTGIYGKVLSMDSLLPIPGARVDILGARKSDSTNATGVFNFPAIAGGSYIVRIKHPFFDSRNVSIVVPASGGTEVDVVMERGRVSRDAHLEGLYRDMDSRLTFRSNNAAFVTSEEFKGREKLPLDQALQFAGEFARRSLRLYRDACVFVDGIARPNMTLAQFSAEDIESIELYATPVGRPRLGDLPNSLRDRWPEGTQCGEPLLLHEERLSRSTVKVRFVSVWLKHR